jgi:N-carbamoylputrescine amidase
MTELRIALLQMTACGTDQDANRRKGEEFVRRANSMNADIALFPEMWNVGYAPMDGMTPDSGDIWRSPSCWHSDDRPRPEVDPEVRRRWQNRAIQRDSPFVEHFRALAQQLDMAIGITYLEKWDGAPRNSLSLIDRHGEIVMTYAKVHTCDFDEPEASTTPGDDFYVVDLDTSQGPVKIGAMICYDREFPESARILMLKGAEIILTPNACDLYENRLAQFRTRAIENMVGVAMTNYAAPRYNGHSVAYHPMAFGTDGPQDLLIVEAGGAEGVYLASFDLDSLRDYRRREAWGNAFRRPHRYGLLTSLEVQEPFIRVAPDGTPYPRASR